MNTEELDRLRLDDIEFFAKRYSELFGEHFDKNTSQEKEEFYKEIKEELLEKAPRYVMVEGNPLFDAQAESYIDRIEFSESSKALKDRALRIHELFHSYNHMEMKKQGLKDFDNALVFKDLDEGSTEMFAQMMCGNEGRDTQYSRDVELTRFLTSIVGERTMIRATRGNPQLLSEITDKIMEKKDFLQNLSKLQYEQDDLTRKRYGHDYFGAPVKESVQILAELKLEETRGKDEISTLFDTAQQLKNREVYSNLVKADKKFGYDIVFGRSLSLDDNKFNPEEPTLASTQQEILKTEIDELDKAEERTPQTVIEKEIKKFLYDKISFQKHFLDYPSPKYDTYELTEEDTKYSENFTSELDGESKRLGGKIGLTGPGNRIYSLENTPYIINENIAVVNKIKDYRLQLWAEKLNIAQTREFLEDWTKWTYNVCYKEMFPEGEEEEFEEAIEAIKRDLDEKEQTLIDKYKAIESEKKQEPDTKETDKETDLTDKTLNEESSSEIEELEEQKIDKLEEVKFEINEFGEIIRQNKDESEIETQVEQVQNEIDSPDATFKNQNENKSLDLWMNRFNGWYGAIDRVSQNAKAKFIKMKSDIVKTISTKIKERSNKKEIDQNQEQDGR